MSTRTTFPSVHLGQEAQIKLNAYPGKTAHRPRQRHRPGARSHHPHRQSAHRGGQSRHSEAGHVCDRDAADPHQRAARRRFRPSAILHLHDRDWVFVPAGGNQFKRVDVQVGDVLPGDRQEILSGIAPGQQVVKAVLDLEATVEAQ